MSFYSNSIKYEKLIAWFDVPFIEQIWKGNETRYDKKIILLSMQGKYDSLEFTIMLTGQHLFLLSLTNSTNAAYAYFFANKCIQQCCSYVEKEWKFL